MATCENNDSIDMISKSSSFKLFLSLIKMLIALRIVIIINHKNAYGLMKTNTTIVISAAQIVANNASKICFKDPTLKKNMRCDQIILHATLH